MSNAVPAIYPALGAIMRDIKAIGKDRVNQQQGFKFRGIDQMYNELHDLMAHHNVIMTTRMIGEMVRRERTTRSGGIISFTLIQVEYDFVSCDDGSKHTVGPILGEGMDSGDKGANKALSIAHKYALLQTFLIPTEGIDDPDAESPQLGAGEPGDAFGDWGAPTTQSAPQGQPPSDPFGEFGPPAQAPVRTFEAGGQQVSINSDEDAMNTASMLATMADKMHSDSLESLRAFWGKNKAVIDYLDEAFPDAYMQLQKTFVTISNRLKESQK